MVYSGRVGLLLCVQVANCLLFGGPVFKNTNVQQENLLHLIHYIPSLKCAKLGSYTHVLIEEINLIFFSIIFSDLDQYEKVYEDFADQ